MLLKYDEKEVLRYLGYRGKPADADALSLIENSYKELLNAVNPKYIYKEYDFERTDGGIIINEILFSSKKLLAHLGKSSKVVLFGATLGHETDKLLRRSSAGNTAYAAVAQAVAASLTENLCDIGCDEIRKELGEIRPRFSPGYGDLELSVQTDFFKLLDMQKYLGVTLMSNLIMTPSKTVTAFVGVK